MHACQMSHVTHIPRDPIVSSMSQQLVKIAFLNASWSTEGLNGWNSLHDLCKGSMWIHYFHFELFLGFCFNVFHMKSIFSYNVFPFNFRDEICHCGSTYLLCSLSANSLNHVLTTFSPLLTACNLLQPDKHLCRK